MGDITYLKTHQGWSYLACVLDLASKEVVGYALSQRPGAKLVNKALRHAMKRQQPNTRKMLTSLKNKDANYYHLIICVFETIGKAYCQ